MRRTPLKRTGPLRRRRKAANPAEDLAAKAVWKEPKSGKCRCGCSPPTLVMHLERHHIVEQQEIKRLGRHDLLWDARNGLLVCPRHHAWHTDHFKLIALSAVPDAARLFAVELMGEGPAAAYFDRHYAPAELAA